MIDMSAHAAMQKSITALAPEISHILLIGATQGLPNVKIMF